MFLAGCDPVRSTQQVIKFKVSDANGNPVSDCLVEIKETLRTDLQLQNGERDSEDIDRQRQDYWDQLPWESVVTKANGEAAINFTSTMIDRNLTEVPPATFDVTGRSCKVRIRGGKPSEVEIQEGLKFAAEGLSISVIEVSPTRYIKTEATRKGGREKVSKDKQKKGDVADAAH